MASGPRLTPLEHRVLLGIPGLFPDGDTDDLLRNEATRAEISYAMQHLIELGLVSASSDEDREIHPGAPYYQFASLTADGEQLRRDLIRPWLVRLLEAEWKWLLSTAIGLCALGLSLWNFFHPAASK